MRTIERLNYDNSFARLPPAFYSRVESAPPKNPHLVSFNADADARDHSEVDRLLGLLKRHFDEQPGMEDSAGFPPNCTSDVHVSCSSQVSRCAKTPSSA